MVVDRFIISVARERESRAQANATITVEVTGGKALATELNMRASAGGSVDSASLPLVDVLMRALSAEMPASRETQTGRTAAASDEGRASATEKPSRRRRPSRAKATAASRRGRVSASADSGRAYRRMPEPEAVLAAYQEVGTISGLADHFGVPLHTVKGWARRLRQMGYEFAR